MDDLVSWLLVQIAEAGRSYYDFHERGCCSLDDLLPFPCDCGYPARVLAECTAKRQIIALHSDSAYSAGVFSTEDEQRSVDTLRIMASVYANGPGFQPEWGSALLLQQKIKVTHEGSPPGGGEPLSARRQLPHRHP